MDWKALVERRVDDDPLTRSAEGLDDGCFFCGADTELGPNWTNFATHDGDCSWVEARRALGLPLGPHKVKPIVVAVDYSPGPALRLPLG